MGITQQIGASSLIKPGVIDNTAARPASPYEGQVIFQKDTDQLLVWNGTAWVIPNSPAQNPTGLEFVSTTTVGTAVSSVTVSGAFSATYDHYVVNIVNMSMNSGGNYLRMALNNVTGSNWYGNGYYMTAGSGTLYGFHNTGSNTQTIGVGDPNTFVNSTVYNPFVVAVPAIVSQYSAGGISGYNGVVQGNANSTASCTGFTISAGGGTLTGGVITVYGIRK